MSKKAKQLLLACAVPVLILLGMCATPLYTLMNGNEILLPTKPIDPSDPFRGDYVTLRYEAEEVPKEMVERKIVDHLQNGSNVEKVYVLLEKKDKVYTPVKVTLEKPKSGIYLKGTLDYLSQNADQKEVAYISYSLDKYFVEDNTGTKLEEAAAKGEVFAKVKVYNGYAFLTDVIEKK